MLFDRDALLSYANVNGEALKIRQKYTDENGEEQERIISPKDATLRQLQEAVIKKFINQAVPKFFNLMSRTTPNIIDNQKPSAQKSWKQLLQNMLTLTQNADVRKLMDKDTLARADQVQAELHVKYPSFEEPIDENASDTLSMANTLKYAMDPRLRERLQKSENKANKKSANQTPYSKTAEGRMLDATFMRDYGESSDYYNQIDYIANSSISDKIEFVSSAREYLDNQVQIDPRFNHVIEYFEDYLTYNPDSSIEDIATYIKETIDQFIHD
jgi:hypothetical protein